MKDVFEELEAKVAQNVVDRKHDEIERKNLLIANDNLIVDCLSKEVFYVAMNSELNTTDSQITKLTDHVTQLQAQNDLFRAKNDKIKQHYKELNNRDAHLDYLRHVKESVETIRDIVEEAKVVRPLDRSIVSACRYTKHSQELLEYAIGTCPQGSQQRAKQHAHTPLIRKKQVTTTKPSDRQDSNKHKHVVTQKTQKTNVHVSHSTGVTSYPKASGSQPKSNPKTNRISSAKVPTSCL
nr:hypothetical protein [Tanacetum cinerariifolium]